MRVVWEIQSIEDKSEDEKETCIMVRLLLKITEMQAHIIANCKVCKRMIRV